MTFPSILKALYKTYSIDACFIADHLSIPDEEVEAWEKEESLPAPKQVEKLSAMFAVPEKTLQSAIEESKKEKNK